MPTTIIEAVIVILAVVGLVDVLERAYCWLQWLWECAAISLEQCRITVREESVEVDQAAATARIDRLLAAAERRMEAL